MAITDLVFREAAAVELPDIVALLADDEKGAMRESATDPLPESYYRAYQAINEDSNARLVIACIEQTLVAVAQINFIANITYQGGTRAMIEGVRVSKYCQGEGIGRALFEHLLSLAKALDCHLVQLTCDKARPDAIAFYQSIGFSNSHEGFKLRI